MRLSPEELISRVEELFTDHGEAISCDGIDDEMFEQLFTERERNLIKNGKIEILSYCNSKEFEVCVEEILAALCKESDYELLDSYIVKAFDGPSLDVYVFSFVIKDSRTGDVHWSLNNIYDRV